MTNLTRNLELLREQRILADNSKYYTSIFQNQIIFQDSPKFFSVRAFR